MTENETVLTHVEYIRETLGEVKADLKEIKDKYVSKVQFYWTVAGSFGIVGFVIGMLVRMHSG